MRARDKRAVTENVRCWCFTLLKKTQKNLGGSEKGLSNLFFEKKKLLNRGAIFAVEVSKEPMKVEYRA